MGATRRPGPRQDTAGSGGPFVRRRLRMVRQQILARGIDDPGLLEAFLATPRHLFVDEALHDRAYSDASLPLGWGQTVSQPYIVARMLQLAAVRPGDKVLEIGTGSGYQAAVLARLAGAVYTLERLEPLARRAGENWARAGVAHVHLRVGDGTLGWAGEAPFAAIVVSAAAPTVPRSLLTQLAPGGRLVIPVGSAVRQVVRRVRMDEAGVRVEDFDPCSFVRLIGREGFAE